MCIVRVAVAIVASLFFVASVGAQTAEQDIEARVKKPIALKGPLKGPQIQFTSQRPPANAEDVFFFLKEVQFLGVTSYEASELQEIALGYLGQEVPLTALYDIAGRVQAHYRNDDFIFTRAIVPAQQIEDGIVNIEVIEAVIENAVVEEPGEPIGPVKVLAEQIVSRLIGQVNPSGALLEDVLFTLNEVPGITRATAVPQAGGAGRGALAIYVNVERDAAEGIIYADNRQTQAVGRGIFGVSYTFNSYGEAADTTTFSLFNSFYFDNYDLDLDERNTVQVEHSAILNPSGLKGSARLLYSQTAPGDEQKDVGILGRQILFSLELSQPLVRSKELNLTAAIGAEFLDSTTDVSLGEINVSDDRLRIASAEIGGLSRDSLGYTLFSLEARQGLPILSSTNAGDVKSRGDGSTDFTLFRADIERQFVVNDEFSFLLRGSGQFAFQPLFASEEFAIGGLTYGRGFDPSVATGDLGVGASGEMHWIKHIEIDEFRMSLETYTFLDGGYIKNLREGEPGSDFVISFGGGLRAYLPDDYVVGVELTHFGATTDAENDFGDRVFFNLTKGF
ncbi:MAG: ShlB/FhaC/HecB family hemolysin secretion/activation protein [Pikeienuella sp.]